MILVKWIKIHKVETAAIILGVGILWYMHMMHAFATKSKTFPNTRSSTDPNVNPFIGAPINDSQSSGKRMEEMLNPDLKRIQSCIKNGTCNNVDAAGGPFVTAQDILEITGAKP